MPKRVTREPQQVGGLKLWQATPVTDLTSYSHGFSLYSVSDSVPDMTDYFAHRCLTNGVRATSRRSDPNWLWVYADKTELPKQDYNIKRGEFPTWTYISADPAYAVMDDLGIKASNTEVSWDAVYGSGKTPNWEPVEFNLNAIIDRKLPMFLHIGYCPWWANRCRSKQYPPSRSVDGEIVTFDSNEKQLAHNRLMTGFNPETPAWLSYPAYVFPYPFETTRFEGHIVTPPTFGVSWTGFRQAYYSNLSDRSEIYEQHQPWLTGPYAAREYPVSLGTEQVWVDNNNTGDWVEWSYIDNFVNGEPLQTNYMLERKGRLRFPWSELAGAYGSSPLAHSSIKASFDLITEEPYVYGLDYVIDEVSGVITRKDYYVEGMAGDNFTGNSLEPVWAWLNEPTGSPAAWAINSEETAGCIYIDARNWGNQDNRYTYGAYLYQTLNSERDTDDFYAQLVIKDCPNYSGGNNQAQNLWVGLMAYKDDDNLFKYVYGWDLGRTAVYGKVNGVAFEKTQILPGAVVYPTPGNPLYLTVAKTGETFGVWIKQTPGWQRPPQAGGTLGSSEALGWCEFQNAGLTFPLKFGISVLGTLGKVGPSTYVPWGVTIDDYLCIYQSTIPEGGDVAVYYDYYYPDDWIDWVRAVVTRYKDSGVWGWEAWNEPMSTIFFVGGDKVNAFLHKDMADTARSVDPRCKIISPGYANDFEGWMQTIYDLYGPRYIDVASWHPYLYTNKSPDLGWQQDYDTNLVSAGYIMRKYGTPGTTAIFGEIGTDAGIYGGGMGLNIRKQAEYAFRLFAMARQLGFVRHFNWWPGEGDQQECGVAEHDQHGPHMGMFLKPGRIIEGNNKPTDTPLEYIECNGATLAMATRYDLSCYVLPGEQVELHGFTLNSELNGVYTITSTGTFYGKSRMLYCDAPEGAKPYGPDKNDRETMGAIKYITEYKPVFYQYKHTINNKGVILDLITYDSNNVEIPSSRLQEVDSVKVGVQDKAKLSSITVKTSISGTDDSCIPSYLSMGVSGPSWAPITKADYLPAYKLHLLNKNHPSLNSASYKFVYNSTDNKFWVVNSVYGTLTSLASGSSYNDGIISFPIPTGPAYVTPAIGYKNGDYYFTETFKGDGYVTQGTWVNDGYETGFGDISVTLNSPVDARYVKIEFEKSTGSRYFLMDEIQVLNTLGTNLVSSNCKYIVDGYQTYFK